MKIIQMMGPNRRKGGEWAQAIAPEVVKLQVKTSGTVVELLTSPFLCFVSLCTSSLQPSP